METAVPLILLLGLLLLGVPVAFSLIVSGIVGILLIVGDWQIALSLLGESPLNMVDTYTITAVPMFILMAFVISESRMADDIFDAVNIWLRRFRAGTPIAVVMSSTVLGAMSGSTTAAAAALSRVAMPSFRRLGFTDALAGGTIALGATLSVLIPPSVMMIFYGIVTETSIGDLFLAGIVPGLILAVLLVLTLQVWLMIRPQGASDDNRATLAEKLSALGRAWPALLLMAGILYALYSGLATPSEIGAVGALLAVVLSFAMRRITFKHLISAATDTIRICAMVLIIVAGGSIFSQFLAMSKLPRNVIAFVDMMQIPAWLIIVLIIVVYFVISMFMDEVPLLLITLPFTFPIVTGLGFDPVWFGVLSIMMVIMGLIFPPVGIVAFIVAKAAAIDIVAVYKGCMILIIPVVLTTAALILWPDLALFLPEMRKR